jgi:hypothetical protein
MIRDVHPGSGSFSYPGSCIQGSKITGSGSATLEELEELKLSKLTPDSDPEEYGRLQ